MFLPLGQRLREDDEHALHPELPPRTAVPEAICKILEITR